MDGSRFGLKPAVRHELQIIVTVRLNVVRELTQETVEDLTFLLLPQGCRRTTARLGLSGNRSVQIIHCSLQSLLIHGRCRNCFLGIDAFDNGASQSDRVGIGQVLKTVLTMMC